VIFLVKGKDIRHLPLSTLDDSDLVNDGEGV